MKFKIFLHKKALKELNTYPSNIRKRIIKSLKEMSEAPLRSDIRPVKNLKGVFRKRIGEYRIFFTIDFKANIIIILQIKHRKQAYKI